MVRVSYERGFLQRVPRPIGSYCDQPILEINLWSLRRRGTRTIDLGQIAYFSLSAAMEVLRVRLVGRRDRGHEAQSPFQAMAQSPSRRPTSAWHVPKFGLVQREFG